MKSRPGAGRSLNIYKQSYRTIKRAAMLEKKISDKEAVEHFKKLLIDKISLKKRKEMAVLGMSCNWPQKRVSYAILEGTKEKPQIVDVGDFKLSGGVNVSSIDNLMEAEKGISDLCENYSIDKACVFTPSGWEKSMRRPDWRDPDLMKFRLETTVANALKRLGIDVGTKHTKKVASDLGISYGDNLRNKIHKLVGSKLHVSNRDQRDAAAAALSILS